MSIQRNRLQITDHAELRFTQRTNGDAYRPREALDESVPIGVPHRDGKGHFHPPTGMIFLVKQQAGVVTTVIDGRLEEDLEASDLGTCLACGLAYDPQDVDQNCPWCDSALDEGDGE